MGHEIIGKAVRVGSKAEGGIKYAAAAPSPSPLPPVPFSRPHANATHLRRVGDRVGVGAQAASCLRPDCEECTGGMEPYCLRPERADTFNGVYPDGSKSYGGYALYNRTPSHFVIKIPDAIPSNEAAPMLVSEQAH